MPTYDYKCYECDNIKEVIHFMSESPEIICEDCGNKMKKLIGAGIGVVFKGDGWTGAALKEKNNRIEKSKKLAKKMDEKRKAGEGVKRSAQLI